VYFILPHEAKVPEVCMDWILDFSIRTPAASNRIMSEISFLYPDPDWIWICFYWKNVTSWLLDIYLPESNRSRIAWF